ncbi:hypothetical protein PTT_00712 [Pyrenophora teres f. teres 0-1]|uniref:Uncharacterized protein n=1 Tax=Pyrenophora teres f. teres (strain 0-1) TaxID=861557 RepID=E3RCM8_PYRTT|nr:hypothetical protein PTT_00712 [Pyrenophora teres f. teres 0-1]
MSKRSVEEPLSQDMNASQKQKITVATNEADKTDAPSKPAKTPKVKIEKAAAIPKVAKLTLKPPVGDGFFDYAYDKTVPKPNEFWGVKPLPGDRRPHPDQPSARESNGQTNPPLWEERGYRYKRGTRHVKYFGPIAPDNVGDLEATLDQEELLVVKVIDMRPKSNTDQTPKRIPTIYCYGRVPRDWNHMQTIKALNDRRYQAIDRMTMDAPWTRIEREYLASLLAENPNASIWELTELHNDRFMNKDFATETGFDFAKLSVGRTVESVRYEYCTYKPLYNKGKAPDMIRWRGDPSMEARIIKKSGRFQKFGPPSRMLQMAFDAAHAGENDSDSDSDSDEDSPQKPTHIKPTDKRKRGAEDDLQENDHSFKKNKLVRLIEVDPFMGQEKLEEEEEMLLQLAGAYVEEVVESLSKEGTHIASVSTLFSAPSSILANPPTSPVNPSLPVDKGKGKVVEKREHNTDTLEPKTDANKSTQRVSSVEQTPAETMEVETTVVQETLVGKVVERKAVSRQTSSVQVQPEFTTGAGRNIVIDDNYDDDEDEEL